jgi:hypothetical protein
MKQTTTVNYTLREIYEFITESFYDIYIHDECEDYECGYNLFNSLKSPEAFVEQVKNGFSPCILPQFHVIEELHRNKSEFVVIVRNHKDQIWAVVNGHDVNF